MEKVLESHVEELQLKVGKGLGIDLTTYNSGASYYVLVSENEFEEDTYDAGIYTLNEGLEEPIVVGDLEDLNKNLKALGEETQLDLESVQQLADKLLK